MVANTNYSNLPDVFFTNEEQRGCIHIMSAKAGFSLPPHSHCFFHVNFILSGRVEIKVGKRTFSAREGSAFVLPPNLPHSLYSAEGYSQIGLDIVKTDTGIYRVISDTFKSCPAIFYLDYLLNDFNTLDIDLTDITPLEKIMLFNFTDKVAINCVRKHTTAVKSDFRGTLQLLFKKENIYSLTVEDICRHLYISKTHLERLMQKNYGCGVKAYINSKKLADIHYYLIETNLPIGEIAKRLNFYDTAHLITFFKRHTGTTPTAFRKNLAVKGEKL